MLEMNAMLPMRPPLPLSISCAHCAPTYRGTSGRTTADTPLITIRDVLSKINDTNFPQPSHPRKCGTALSPVTLASSPVLTASPSVRTGGPLCGITGSLASTEAASFSWASRAFL